MHRLNPGMQRITRRIAERLGGCRNAAPVREVMLDGPRLLRRRVFRPCVRVAARQVRALLSRPVPALESVLCWITQLVNGLGDSLAEFDVKRDCSDSISVGIHELLSGSQVFRGVPTWSIFGWRQHLSRHRAPSLRQRRPFRPTGVCARTRQDGQARWWWWRGPRT